MSVRKATSHRSRRVQRTLTSAAVITLLTAAAAACSSSSSSATGAGAASSGSSSATPISVAAITADTGPTGPYGAADAAGVKAEVALVNAAGGVLGHKLTYTGIDDGGDQTKAASAGVQLLSSSNPPLMIWAGATTLDSGALLQELKKESVVTFESSNVDITSEAGPYNYNIFPLASQQNTAFVDALKQIAGANPKVGVISTSDVSGSSATAADKTALAGAHLTLTGTEAVSPTATDVTSELQALRSSGATALLSNFVNPTLYVTMMDDVKALGWNTVKVIGATSAIGETVLTGVPKTTPPNFAALGTDSIIRPSASAPLPAKTSQFVSAFTAAGGQTAFLLEGFQGADAVNLLTWAIKKANSVDPAAVNAALESTATSSVPAADLYQVPPPAFSATNKSLNNADFGNYWALVYPSAPQDGIYVGSTIPGASS